MTLVQCSMYSCADY